MSFRRVPMRVSSGGNLNAHGASTTARQAAGRSASVSEGRGFEGVGDGLGCSTASVNHQSKSLPQPSPAGTGSCGLHSGLSAGHLRRTWKW